MTSIDTYQRNTARTVGPLFVGPDDHGCPVSEEALVSAEYAPGFQYEIIDGRWYVSPLPNLPENRLENWLFGKLFLHAMLHPKTINYVTSKPRVFVPDRPKLTVPEPDIAAYRRFPIHKEIEDVDWRSVSPILVAEVLTGDPEKDLDRNVELYWQVPSIREYWVLDGRESLNRPTLKVHRRYGKRWIVRDWPFDSILKTRLLPAFELRIKPTS